MPRTFTNEECVNKMQQDVLRPLSGALPDPSALGRRCGTKRGPEPAKVFIPCLTDL
jgi:hypothetical protein